MRYKITEQCSFFEKEPAMNLKEMYYKDKRVRDLAWEIDDLCWDYYIARLFHPDEKKLSAIADQKSAKIAELKSLLQQSDAGDLDMLREIFALNREIIRANI
jgi:hypothetical protein